MKIRVRYAHLEFDEVELDIDYTGDIDDIDQDEVLALLEKQVGLGEDNETEVVNIEGVHFDVWLRIPTGEEESEAEANTRMTDTGYAVDWCITAVGLVKTREFDTLADAYDWLQEEGFVSS